MLGATGVRTLSTGLSAHRVRESRWLFQEVFLSLGFQKRPAPLRLSGCASNSRGKDSKAVSENAVDCENTEPVGGWVEVDVDGTRHREVLFCGSEVALDSDVAVLAAGADIGKHSQILEIKLCRRENLRRFRFLCGFALLPARFDES